jgi:hypothetical protein
VGKAKLCRRLARRLGPAGTKTGAEGLGSAVLLIVDNDDLSLMPRGGNKSKECRIVTRLDLID